MVVDSVSFCFPELSGCLACGSVSDILYLVRI
jgi:hypothetical protein